MITFANKIRRDLFNVFVVGYREGGVQEERMKAVGIECASFNGRVEPILNYIKQKKIDIIHMHRSGGYVPLETGIINGAMSINPEIIILEKNVFGKFDHVSGFNIGCSMFQSMMQLHKRYLPVAKTPFDFQRMKVFYNMVDSVEFEKYRLSFEKREDYKKSLGIAPDEPVVGKIARPHIAKWSDLIIDMVPYLVALVPRVKLLIIGVPKSRINRIKKNKYAKHIVMLDETSNEADVHRFYQIIDILAHSSKIGECNGNTINEAMYWSRPVIVNSTPRKDNGQLEQVDHMINGIIANYPQTYARACAFLLNNMGEREKMGKNAHDKVVAINDPVRITSMLEKVFVEQMMQKGFEFDSTVTDSYASVNYYPTEAVIRQYPVEYLHRLSQDYGILSLREKLFNYLRKPVKFYYKVMDFIEDKISI